MRRDLWCCDAVVAIDLAPVGSAMAWWIAVAPVQGGH
jgi:hypothetical protein